MASKVYDKITERVLELLEEGTAPWRRPWVTAAPQSVRGRPYRGINALLLGLQEYGDPRWLTFREAQRRGGSVRKGEKGTPVVFWRWITNGSPNDDEEAAERAPGYPLARTFYLWNVEQCEELSLPPLLQVAEDVQPVAAAEAVVAGYEGGPVIEYGAAFQAAYIPGLDVVQMPTREQFRSVDRMYATLFHELGHSTGHPSRLNRSQEGGFGSHDYGREELIAEFCAAFLCAETGIDPSTQEQNAAYIDSWSKTIEADKKLVVLAAASAQRAADHVLGRTFEADNAGEEEEAPAHVQRNAA